MPIPLLRSPLLVLDEVIKNIEIKQLFLLTLCSKRMHLIVKTLRDKSKQLVLKLLEDHGTVSLFLVEDYKNHLVLRVRAMPESGLEGWTADKYRGAVFQRKGLEIESYWEGLEEGTRCLLEHVSDLFSVQVQSVHSHSNSLWILDLVEELQGPRSYEAFCTNTRITDEQLRHLLVDLNPTSLDLSWQSSHQFRIEKFHKTYETLSGQFGDWMSGKNLLTLDCVRLITHYKMFTATEINRFLRHVLIEGGAPRLTEFRSLLDNADANEILDGIREVLKPIEQFEDNIFFWKFSALFDRGGRLAMVSIVCHKESVTFFQLRIGQ